MMLFLLLQLLLSSVQSSYNSTSNIPDKNSKTDQLFSTKFANDKIYITISREHFNVVSPIVYFWLTFLLTLIIFYCPVITLILLTCTLLIFIPNV